MKYDFDKVIDRSNTLSCKWDETKKGGLPMWIADMDFETAPCVKSAIAQRVSNGAFGYSYIPDAYYEAIRHWWGTRYHWDIRKEWIIFSTGVIPSISSVVRRLTHPNDNVVLLTPIYNTFYNCIINQGARALDCPLDENDGIYTINFEKLEADLALPTTTLMIFCNPQNPTGNIWTEEEMIRVGELCAKHNVTVISDEIHCDLTDPGYKYIPFAGINELNADISITCLSPGKSFNMAGLNSSCMVIKNRRLYDVVFRGLNNDECAEPNAFAMQATIAAYTEGEEWLDELREYLFANKLLFREKLHEALPDVKVVSRHATYLLWIDVRSVTDDTVRLCDFIYEKTGLFIIPGERYHEGGYVRINVACPKSMVLDGVNRFIEGIRLFK